MKKINILLVLGGLILLFGLTQSAYALGPGQGNYEVETWHGDCFSKAAQVNAATKKFEGLLNAYSATQNQNMSPVFKNMDSLYAAASNLSNSLEQFNTALMEVYPTLTEEGQLAIQNGVVDIIKALQSVTAEANLVFGREVFRIEYRVSKIISIINSL